jgi:signal transduction histidine kinase
MVTNAYDVTTEMRISPRVPLAMLVVLHALLCVVVQILPYPSPVVSQTLTRFLLFFALCLAGWQLTTLNERLARWFSLSLLAVGLGFAGFSLGMPVALAWLSLVPILAIALISFPVAFTFAALSSVLTIAFARALAADTVTTVVRLFTIWGSFGALGAVARPLHERMDWLHQYFRDVRLQLEEVRDRRASYEQALDDLTYANRQLVLMNQRVASLREIAEQAQESKTHFVARVSHEFRTPLNMIIGLVDLMVTAPQIYDVSPSPRLREALRVVHRNCEHLSDMVDDVLDLTRIEMIIIFFAAQRYFVQGVVLTGMKG